MSLNTFKLGPAFRRADRVTIKHLVRRSASSASKSATATAMAALNAIPRACWPRHAADEKSGAAIPNELCCFHGYQHRHHHLNALGDDRGWRRAAKHLVVTPQNSLLGSQQRRYFSSASASAGKNHSKHGVSDARNNETSVAAGGDTANSEEASVTANTPGAPPGLPGSQSGGKKLAIVFTCTVCNTRSAKQFTEHAYRHGVVIVQCPGCKNQHLIADNLSMFTGDDVTTDKSQNEKWNIETAMARLGQPVTTVTNENVFEITLDQVVGAEALEKAMRDVRASAGRNKKAE